MSLNKAVREKEIADADQKRKARNQERLARFAEISKQDKETTKFYKLTLADVNENKPIATYDPSVEDDKYMRKAKDETAELDDTPKWPSGIDMIKRESLAILMDLTHATETAKAAGAMKKTAER
jgi:carboxyl-terminal processing protease